MSRRRTGAFTTPLCSFPLAPTADVAGQANAGQIKAGQVNAGQIKAGQVKRRRQGLNYQAVQPPSTTTLAPVT